MLNYRIRNKDNEYFNLYDLKLNMDIPNSVIKFAPSISAYKITDKISPRYSGYGGVLKGDGKFADRDMTFKFHIATRNIKHKDLISGLWILDGQLEHRKILNWIARFFRPEKRDFWLENMDYALETKISHDGIKPKTSEGLEYITSEYELPLSLIDGLWLGKEVEVTGSIALNYGTFTIDIDTDSLNSPVYPFDAFPVIELTTTGSNSDFTLYNQTNNYSLRVQELGFIAGKKITLDSVDGKAFLDKTEKLKMITSGYFLYLSPGANVIEYYGLSPIGYTIKYRPRYLY